SLTKALLFEDTTFLKNAVASWVCRTMPAAPPADAQWIIQHRDSSEHEAWWRDAISSGLTDAFRFEDPVWLATFWSWAEHDPVTLAAVVSLLPLSQTVEARLVDACPQAALPREAISVLVRACG